MSEDITLFNAGDKVTAEETNKNNQLLKGWALDDKATQSWVTSQLSSLSSTLTSQINSVSNGAVKTTGNQSIAGNKTFSGTVKVPNSATTGTAISTQAISKSANGYLKMGNGVIIQWGTYSNGKVTFPTAFSSYARVAISGDYSWNQLCYVSEVTKTYFTISNNTSSTQTPTRQWIAVGY